jgi:hypothetical protein
MAIDDIDFYDWFAAEVSVLPHVLRHLDIGVEKTVVFVFPAPSRMSI